MSNLSPLVIDDHRDRQFETSTNHVAVLLRTSEIRVHEQFDPLRVDAVFSKMREKGQFTTPILVAEGTRVLLDGHHRLRAVIDRLKARYIPAILVDYNDLELVSVSSWRDDIYVDREVVTQAAFSNQLLPVRTSRHSLSIDVGLLNIPLADLGQSL